MLKFVGDINLTDGYFDVGFGVGSKVADGFDPFYAIDRDDADLWIGNFEGVTADVSEKNGVASHQFLVKPEHITHLHHMDAYGFANNHAMQHGAEAYRQSVAFLEKMGSKVFGVNQQRTITFEHQGSTISLTGFSQRIDAWSEKPEYWHNPEYKEVLEELKDCHPHAFKIAYIHWGNEFINYPSSPQKKFAHWLVDVGFDLVIGMHPHILQGYEVYNGKYIFYSLGNFVFDMAWEPTHYGAIVNVDFLEVQPLVSYEYIKIGEDYSPRIVNADDVPDQFRFETLNGLVTKEENSEEYHAAINKYYKQYRKSNHKDIAKKILQHPPGAISIIKDFIKRRL